MRGPEPISPELALVSPELAEAARRALPDRPWEAFAPPRPQPQLRVAPPAREPLPPAPAAVPPSRRRVVTGGRLVTTAIVVLLVASAFLPPRNAPRLVAAPTPPASTTPAETPRCAKTTGGQRGPFRPLCPPPHRR